MVDTRIGGSAVRSVDDRKALLLGMILILLQAADGLLTSVGVSRFGVSVEGNPFLRHLMMEFGHLTTLTMVKFIAIAMICAMTYYATRQPWIRSAMGAVSAIYLFAAIIPWTYILFIKPYFA